MAAAEDFCQRVLYIPISSLALAPEMDSDAGMLAIRPDRITPRWVTAPILYMLGKWSKGLVPVTAVPEPAAPATAAQNPARQAAVVARTPASTKAPVIAAGPVPATAPVRHDKAAPGIRRSSVA